MNKKKLLLVLALVAVVLYLVLRNQPQSESKQERTAVNADETELVILSVNDMHSSIDMFPIMFLVSFGFCYGVINI